MNTLNNLKPAEVWKHFTELNKVPRPSKKEEKVIAFIKAFGEKCGLPTRVDETGNVIIEKKATPGMEDRQTVVLQSHLDMVCQKNNDTDFDFETQGIEMYEEDGWVKAKGTTLGADNGMGVAAIMAILESADIPHPALEALFTIDEETGMTGAKGLKENELKGTILLNLDTEEDDEIDIGCAGGVDVTATKKHNTEDASGQSFTLSVKGLQGGHSGMDIIKGLANANVLLFRFLNALKSCGLRLEEIQGGGLRNAIPREAEARFTLSSTENAESVFDALKSDIMQEFKSLEPGMKITLEKTESKDKVLSEKDSVMLIRAVTAAHNGVFRMSPDIEGLVEASNNIANVVLKDGEFSIKCLTRSSVESSKKEVAAQLEAAFSLAGCKVNMSGDYPGWKPVPDAEIIHTMTEIYTEKFGEKPKVVACHAGLECGIIGASHPKLQMVSFGPNIRGAHSPDERVEVQSVEKFWSFLKDILSKIPKK